ncbi:MAG: hypothetical protein IIA45_11725 [Bacteroidetes bacterium]|nr:hypothetical protein [Bacteroidota bacterium]
MLEGIPLFLPALFLVTVLLSLQLFYFASKTKIFLIIVIIWVAIQSILGSSGIYNDPEAMPPRLMLGIAPAILGIILMFLTKKGRQFIDNIDLKRLTYFHSIRILVEIVLIMLYFEGMVSVLMTFEGNNFDIFSGVTAPLVAFLAFRSGKIRKGLLWGWNIICLLLLLNVVITAIFTLPSPLQRFSFDQPNVAILEFPFNLLPTVVVPLVLFAHLVAFRLLLKKQQS